MSSIEPPVADREFRPHVTIARNIAARRPIQPITPVQWPFDELALVESTPGATGSEYRVIARWPLS